MTENKIRKTIESIKRDFVKFIEDNNLLKDYVSIFVVGSFAGTEYKTNKINDLDLRVIFKKMTYEKAKLLELFLKECERKYNSTDVDISSSTVIGIAKPKKANGAAILIHLIYLDIEEFQKLPMIHTNTYIKFNQLLKGKELRELKNINIDIDNVIDDFEGLKHCIDMLKTNKLKYLEWELSDKKFNVKLKERYIEDEELIQCIKYSLFKPIINLLNIKRVETNDIEKTIEIIFNKKKFHNLPHKEVFLEFKSLLKEKYNIKKIKNLKEKSIKFLESFENYINNFNVEDIMYEVEIVAKIKNINDIKKNLLNSKHLFIKEEKQAIIFLTKKKTNTIVRIRISPDKTILSFKGGEFNQAREEIESEVKDYEAIYKMFTSINFKVETFFLRKRELYTNKKQNIIITLDQTKGSSSMIEIEKIIEDKKQENKIRQELKKYSSDFLGIKEFISKDEFYKMLDNYKKKNKNKKINFKEINAFLNS